jgi:hypothetical protein
MKNARPRNDANLKRNRADIKDRQMDVLTSSPMGQVPCPAIVSGSKTPPRTPTVELVGIIPNKQFVLVAVRDSDGRFNWSVECTPADVQCGIWIQHASQEELRPARRADEWAYAVTAAFARGKAAVA